MVYLTYTEGHTASSGERLVRADLCAEAVRLARLLTELMPDEPEALGLLALLLLSESRRAARSGPAGELVGLAEQDRSTWDRDLIADGQQLVRRCLRRGQPGPYQLQAAIAAVHSDADSTMSTDWRQALALYDQLLLLVPTPVVAVNRAVALAEVEGAATALTVVDSLDLRGYGPRDAVRADLLRRLGRTCQARDAYDAAIASAGNDAEHAFLTRRQAELLDGPGDR